MSVTPPDTQKINTMLQNGNFSPRQAAALSEIIKNHDDGYREQFVTQKELENFGNKLMARIAGAGIILVGTIIGLLNFTLSVAWHQNNAATQVAGAAPAPLAPSAPPTSPVNTERVIEQEKPNAPAIYVPVNYQKIEPRRELDDIITNSGQ